MEIAVFANLYLASALLYGADRTRGRTRFAPFAQHRAEVRGVALLLLALALARWRAYEPGPAASLVVLAGTTAFGSLIALATPFFPRTIAALGAAALLTVLVDLTSWLTS